jgi:hypothetical protein
MTVLTPDYIAQLLKLQKIGELYPDYPPNFVPPGLSNPNYVPPFRGHYLFNSAVVLSALLLIIVPLRLIVRLRFRQSAWGWDDTLIIPATILALTINALDIFEIYRAGVGHHAYDDTYAELKLAYLLQFIHLQLYIWATLAAKLSICCFYLRLQCPGRVRNGLKFFMGFITVLNLASFLIIMFTFKPVRAAWDIDALLDPHSGTNFHIPLFVQSAIYVVVDFIIWMIPIPIMWGLQMSLRKRLGLIGLFSLGFLACITIIVRTVLIWTALNTYDGTCKYLVLSLFYFRKAS